MNQTKIDLHCNVCKTLLNKVIYKSARDLSITSLCQVWPVSTKVFFCDECGHVQTQEETNLVDYYAEDYKILLESEEEDQIYEIRNGEKIFRTDHQVDTFFSLVSLPKDARILDFGCAKSSTLKRIVQREPGLVPYLFDVSDMYLPYWERFVEKENWAIGVPKSSWEEYFDIVTSFFSLEHAADAEASTKQIGSVLKPGGLLYAIVPNIFTNIADLVVVDHVNHFTETSIRYVLKTAGFSLVKLETDLHTGAFVILAKKDGGLDKLATREQIASSKASVQKMVSFWQKASDNIQSFEADLKNHPRAAIYGSGFYGTFIGTCLKDLSKIDCVIDQNPFLQGKKVHDKPVVAPEKLPAQIEVIYVGLNPRNAKKNIEAITSWNDRNLKFFYL